MNDFKNVEICTACRIYNVGKKVQNTPKDFANDGG